MSDRFSVLSLVAVGAALVMTGDVEAQDQAGDVLLNNFNGPAIARYRSDGAMVGQTSGESGVMWEGAALLSGDRWMTSRRNPCGVNIFDATGIQLATFDTPQIRDFPADTDVLSDGTLVVGDQDGKVELYTEAGSHIRTIGVGQVILPFGIHVDHGDDIWVADRGPVGVDSGTIWEFDKTASLMTSITTDFEPDDLVLAPDGTIWCSDVIRGIVKHLDVSGALLGSFQTAITSGFHGIGMAPDGSLICAGKFSTDIYRYDQAGALLDSFSISGGPPLFLTVVGPDGPATSCQAYCGTGANAPTDGFVVTNPAVLGGSLNATVRGCAASSAGAFLAGFSSSLSCMSNWGEILVNIADPNGELLGLPTSFEDPAPIRLPVPNDPTLAGFVLYTQAVSFGGGICFHCAHECTIGY